MNTLTLLSGSPRLSKSLRVFRGFLIPICWFALSVSIPAKEPASAPDFKESPRKIAPPASITKPVLTPQNVKVNKTQPKVIPFSGELKFSDSPTNLEITRASVLSDSLIPSGKTSSAENKALAQALISVQRSAPEVNLEPLIQFMQKYPNSAWNISLELNLGIQAYFSGYFSKALAFWESAWKQGKDLKDPAIKAQVDRAFGELVRMHARIGNRDRLKELFAELGKRPLTGSATELVANSKDGYWMMENKPGVSFLCGPAALGSIFQALNPSVPSPEAIRNAASTQKGFALSEVEALAKKSNLHYQMAFWQDPSAGFLPPLPALVHWKVGHYASILREENGFLLVRDPTFGQDLWIRREALVSEASGYFLIPQGDLAQGWRKVPEEEGKGIFGKGNTTASDGNALTPKDPQAGSSCPIPQSPPMAYASVYLMLVSLHLEDTPVSYIPPKGPSVHFTLSYNQRDMAQPSSFNYSNLGIKWTFNWLSYVNDDPSSTSAPVGVYAQGGGVYPFKNFNSGTQTFDPQFKTQGILKRTSASTYEYNLPDGSKQIFGLSDGRVVSGRHVYLTEIKDPAGNSIFFTYDSQLRLTNVTDTLGQVTTLSYTHPTDSLKITKVTDPFGRYATLEYDSSGRLQKITDPIGITSEFTYATDFITSLTTPYGTETYAFGQDISTTRWLNLTDVQGVMRRVEYRHEAPGISATDPSTTVPSGQGLTNDYLQYRNTFYWDKKAWTLYPGDYTKAEITHFLHVAGGDTTTSGIVESTKKPFENRIWYTYAGQSNSYHEGTTDKPSKILQNLNASTDAEVTQLYKFTYNTLGNITETIDPLNRRTDYAYAANKVDLLSVNKTTGAMNELLATATYNSQHLPLTVTDASGQTTTFTYNSAGQVTTILNAKSELTTLTYDASGFLTQIDGPASGTSDKVTFSYDGFNRVRTITDSEGYTLTYDYDVLSRLTQTTYPNGKYDQFIYNRLDLVWQRDREARWTHQFFNSVRQRMAVQDTLGRVTNFEWCRCGALQGLTDAMGRVTRWVYDVEGRLTQKIYPDGTKLNYTYEPATSRLKSVADAKSQRSNYEYFLDDQLKKVGYTDLSGAALSPPTPDVQWTYDAGYGRLATMVDTTGTTTYNYNTIPITPALGAGRLASVDGPVAGSGDQIAFSYDELGRVTQRSINSVVQTMQYDNLGRMTNISNPLGAFVYHYLNYTERLSSIDLPNGQSTQFNYFNNAGDQRLEEIKNLDAQSTPGIISKFNMTYAPAGDILTWRQEFAGSSGSGRQYDLRYDAADQLLEGTLKDAGSGAILKNNVYRYDKAGNRTSEQIDLGVTSLANNNLNQVTSAIGGSGPLEFSGSVDKPATVTVGGNPAQVDYSGNFRGAVNLSTGTSTVAIVATDFSGNIKTQNYQVTVPAGGAHNLAYDLNGNLIDDGSGKTYAWDAANRMIKITYGSGGSTELTYDGMGRRVKIVEKNGSGAITSDKRFLWDGMEICEERDSSNTVTKRYYGQGMVRGASGTPSSTDKFYYTRDHLGSIRELTDSSAGIQASWNYDLYGRQALPPGGLQTWLRADSINQASGTAVAQWNDQSGKGQNATQGSSGNQPTVQGGSIGGKPAVRFDGTNDFLAFGSGFSDFSAGMTVFVVAKPTAVKNWVRFFDFGNGEANGNLEMARYSTSNDLAFEGLNGSAYAFSAVASSQLTLNEAHVYTGKYTGTTSTIYKDGVQQVQVSATAISVVTRTNNYLAKSNWAADDYFAGDMAEVIVYNRSLSTIEQKQVETYLLGKYGLGVVSDFRYTGQYYHERSGLTLAPYRSYDADLGRWLARDPIEEDGGINLYAYVENDPINNYDPLGLINSSLITNNRRPGEYKNLQAIPNVPGRFSIGGHGESSGQFVQAPDGKTWLDAKDLAKLIKNHPDYKPGMPVDLYFCNSGQGDNPIAKQLAKELHAPVTAPDGYLSVDSTGKESIGPKIPHPTIPNEFTVDKSRPGSRVGFPAR